MRPFSTLLPTLWSRLGRETAFRETRKEERLAKPRLTLLPHAGPQPPEWLWDAAAAVFQNTSLSPKPLPCNQLLQVPKSTVRDSFFLTVYSRGYIAFWSFLGKNVFSVHFHDFSHGACSMFGHLHHSPRKTERFHHSK